MKIIGAILKRLLGILVLLLGLLLLLAGIFSALAKLDLLEVADFEYRPLRILMAGLLALSDKSVLKLGLFTLTGLSFTVGGWQLIRGSKPADEEDEEVAAEE
ncbi:MAG: hypothetical protein VB862_05560 [Pirellulaceae bacterium]